MSKETEFKQTFIDEMVCLSKMDYIENSALLIQMADGAWFTCFNMGNPEGLTIQEFAEARYKQGI